MPYGQFGGFLPQQRPQTAPSGAFEDFLNAEKLGAQGFYSDWLRRGSQPRFSQGPGMPDFASQQRRFSPNQQNFYRGGFEEIYNNYLGALTNQGLQGGTPDLKFTDYMSGPTKGGFNPFDYFNRMTPRQRGDRPGAYAPPVRWGF